MRRGRRSHIIARYNVALRSLVARIAASCEVIQRRAAFRDGDDATRHLLPVSRVATCRHTCGRGSAGGLGNWRWAARHDSRQGAANGRREDALSQRLARDATEPVLRQTAGKWLTVARPGPALWPNSRIVKGRTSRDTTSTLKAHIPQILYITRYNCDCPAGSPAGSNTALDPPDFPPDEPFGETTTNGRIGARPSS